MTSALRKLLLIVTAVLLVGSASAAELTLDDCINLALKNRAVIIQAHGREKVAAAGRRAALGAFLPNLSASYSYVTDLSDSYSSPQGTGDFLGLSLTWQITPINDVLNYWTAKASLEAARLDVIGSEQDLILAVKLAYFDYLSAEQNVSVSEDAVKRSEEQLKLIQSRFDLGSASLSDVLKQKVQFGNDRLNLLRAQNSVTSSRATLAYTIGVDPRIDQQFSSTFAARTYEGSLDEAVDFALQHQPELLSAEKSLKAANYDVSSTMTEYIPRLTFALSADKGWSSPKHFGAFSSDEKVSSKSGTIGYQMTWNIFDGFAREARVTSAKVARNNQRAGLADLRNRIASEVATAYTNIRQYQDQKSVAQENVTASEEDLKITQEKYNLGAATILDLLTAQVSLRQAQVDLIRADFDLNLAISRLENAMGKM